MQEYTDAELVKRYQETLQPEFIGELFSRHSAIIYRTAYRIMKRSSDAEDIMQIACCKMISDLKDYKGTGSVLGWVLQMVIHTCYNQKQSEKSRQNRDQKFMSERTMVAEPKNYEMAEMIEVHLNKLPEIYKTPIVLQIMEGLSVKEVSEALELPEKTIRTQITRGLEKLKASLGRVGITASITTVGEMLSLIKQPMVPDLYKGNQFFQKIYQSQLEVTSQQQSIAGVKSLFNLKMGLLISSVGVLMGVFYLGYLKPFNNEQVRAEPLAISVAPTKKLPKMYRKWDFEKSDDLNDLKIISGSAKIVSNIGLNESKALEVEKGSMMVIDISEYHLPIKISFVFDNRVANGETGGGFAFLKSNYEKEKNIFHFVKLHSAKLPETPKKNRNANANVKTGYFGEWFYANIYVSEEAIDSWFHDVRSGLIYGRSIDNKKIYITFYDPSIIDNFVIETVETENIPEFSKFSEFSGKQPFIKGYKPYYHLNSERRLLGLEKDSFAELGICDSETAEQSITFQNKDR